MKKLRVIALFLTVAMLLSPALIFRSNASGPLYKVFFVGLDANKGGLLALNANIIEDYGSFVLTNLDSVNIGYLNNNGYTVLPCEGYDTVTINGVKLHPNQDRILVPEVQIPEDLLVTNIDPFDNSYFIFQFIGPIKDDWTSLIEESGGVVVGTLHNNAVIVRATPQSASAIRESSKVTGGIPYHPFFKISPAIVSDEQGYVFLSISLHDGEQPRDVAHRIPGAVISDITAPSGGLRIRCKFDQVRRIALDTAVSHIQPFVQRELSMDVSRQVMGIQGRTAISSPPLPPSTRGLWDEGLRGQGEVACIQDTGYDTGNFATLKPDIGVPPRIVAHFGYDSYPPGPNPGPDPDQTKPWNDTNSHGTFTTAQVLGDGALSGGQYSGVAPEAGAVVQRGLGWMNPGLPDSYRYGARVHSNSWGSSQGEYDEECQYVDWFVKNNPDMVIVIAAGNSGPGANTVGIPAAAKNSITVGAAGNNKYQTQIRVLANPGDTTIQVNSTTGFGAGIRVCIAGTNSPVEDEYRGVTGMATNPPLGPRITISSPLVFQHTVGQYVHSNHCNSMARFSSRGPTDEDQRLKPDVVAPGLNVMGLVRFPPPSYRLASGTSMATPNTAGCAVLARQWLRQAHERPEPSAALVKALLINGARNLTEDYNGTALNYPDPIEGWGEVDMYNTLYPPAPTKRKFYDYKRGVSTGGRIDFPIVASPGRLKVTLAWSDFYSVPGANPHLVNDLDLVVVDPTTLTSYRGNQFDVGTSESTPNATATDVNNNVEGITVNSAAFSGVYMVSVFGANVPQGPQPFAVVVEYQATLPDFDVRARPDAKTIQTNTRFEEFRVNVNSINGFNQFIDMSVSVIPQEFNSSFKEEKIKLNPGATQISFLSLVKTMRLKLGKYYIVVRGTSQDGKIYHEDTVELILRPAKDYDFQFTKAVGLGAMGNFGDDGKQAKLGQKLWYALDYDKDERKNFSQLYVDDIIPEGTNYTGTAFPAPTHYSLDNGATWTNAKPPANAGFGVRLRWALHEIEGSGRFMRLSNGVPGFDNVSANTGASTRPIMKLDSRGFPHIVWQDFTTSDFNNREVFYTMWNGTRWCQLDGVTAGYSNVSNTTGTFSEYIDMALDAQDRPHFVWIENWTDAAFPWNAHYQVIYTRWNGATLTNADGLTPGLEILTAAYNDRNRFSIPRMIMFGDMPHVTFANIATFAGTQQGAYFTKWNGTSWVRMDGTSGIEVVHNSFSNYPYGLCMGVNSLGQPHIVFEQVRYFWWFIMVDELLGRRWNGAQWGRFDGTTAGSEQIMPNNRRAHSYPNIAFNVDTPHLVWQDDTPGYGIRNEIIYTKFVGSQWQKSDNTPGYEVLTNSTERDIEPVIELLPGGFPAIAWSEVAGGVGDIKFTWYKNGWSNLTNTGWFEKITDNISDSIYPQVRIDATGQPYFALADNMDGDYDIYVTYPVLAFSTARFPGRIVWEAKILEEVPPGLADIKNTARMSGVYDTPAYFVQTGLTEASTVNPLTMGIGINVSAKPSSAALNGEILFTVKVENKGSVPVSNVTVSTTLPKGMAVITTQPNSVASSNGIKWGIPRLNPGAAMILRLWAKVTDASYQGRVIVCKFIASGTGKIAPAEDYASIYILKNTTGFPDTDLSFKLVTENPKAGQDLEFVLDVWAGNAPFSYEIDWGDGSAPSLGNVIENKSVNIKHAFSGPGTYTINCTITDRYGNATTKTLKINVK